MMKIIISLLLFVSGVVLATENNGENKTLVIGTSERRFYYDISPGEHHYIDHTGRPITNGRVIFHHVDVNNQGTNHAASFHEFAKIYAGQFHFIQIAPGAFKDINIAAYKDIVSLLDNGGSLLCSPNYDPEIVNHPNFYIIYKHYNTSLINILHRLAKKAAKNDLYVLRKITTL